MFSFYGLSYSDITQAESKALAAGVAALTKGVVGVNVVLFPPQPFLVPVYDQIKDSNVELGGQNCYFENRY
jgi:triosephosphate isomerase